jgi:hypothetical protein
MLLEQAVVEPHGARHDLVLLVHGYRGRAAMAHLLQAVTETLPDADVLAPRYRSGPFRNADVRQLGASLDDLIADTCRRRAEAGAPYRKLVLVGHSLGTLVLRTAYVFGLGSSDDHPVPGPAVKPRDWVGLVDRLVLLGALSRGWSLRPRPQHMGRLRHAALLAWLGLARLTGRGTLLRSGQRGAPAVANLRIQWIRLSWSRVLLAPVVHLLGTMDELVGDADSRDMSTASSFIQVSVSETGHADIVDFDASVAGQRRRDRFREALGEPIEKLRSRYAEDTRRVREEQFQRTDHVVFVLHGIRDTGGWRAALAEKIEALGKGEVTVRRPAYPFFPMAPFLLANRRQRFVRTPAPRSASSATATAPTWRRGRCCSTARCGCTASCSPAASCRGPTPGTGSSSSSTG